MPKKSSRSKNTEPELLVRKKLYSWGLRFRIHVRSLPGTPDIVFPSQKLAIFINGCFWHQHGNCKIRNGPDKLTIERRKQFISAQERDAKSVGILEKLNWNCLTLWECEIKSNLINECAKISKLVGINKVVKSRNSNYANK